MNLNFEAKSLLDKAKGTLAELGSQKGAEAVNQANLLLKLLQDAGYRVGELEMELGVPPTITIDLKPGPLLSDSKLDSVYQANKDNEVLALVLGSLIQANKLRDMVNVEALELDGATIVLKAPPSITLHWKEKTAAKVASAS
jgi:hypothetical protein